MPRISEVKDSLPSSSNFLDGKARNEYVDVQMPFFINGCGARQSIFTGEDGLPRSEAWFTIDLHDGSETKTLTLTLNEYRQKLVEFLAPKITQEGPFGPCILVKVPTKKGNPAYDIVDAPDGLMYGIGKADTSGVPAEMLTGGAQSNGTPAVQPTIQTAAAAQAAPVVPTPAPTEQHEPGAATGAAMHEPPLGTQTTLPEAPPQPAAPAAAPGAPAAGEASGFCGLCQQIVTSTPYPGPGGQLQLVHQCPSAKQTVLVPVTPNA